VTWYRCVRGLDEAVDAQSTSEVVGDLPAGHVLIAPAEQRREVGAEFAVGESVRQQPERAHSGEQGLDAFVGESQAGDAGSGRGDDGAGDGGDRGGAGGGVVADFLDAQQALVGGEADLPQCGQVR
jgi:hypothetical protein